MKIGPILVDKWPKSNIQLLKTYLATFIRLYPIFSNLPIYPILGYPYVDGTLKYNFSQDVISSTPYMTALVNRFSRQIESMVVLNTFILLVIFGRYAI